MPLEHDLGTALRGSSSGQDSDWLGLAKEFLARLHGVPTGGGAEALHQEFS